MDRLDGAMHKTAQMLQVQLSATLRNPASLEPGLYFLLSCLAERKWHPLLAIR